MFRKKVTFPGESYENKTINRELVLELLFTVESRIMILKIKFYIGRIGWSRERSASIKALAIFSQSL